MSPLIDIQRRLVQVGRIRMGERNERGHPTRLEHWRLTSRDQIRLRAAAEVFGGSVRPWEARPGEYELYTEVDTLPILLMPGQTISAWYELWSGGGCKRRCDGETEQLTDGPCLCDVDNRECKPHTRLNVLLPDVPGIGCWRLDSTGWNAAHELAGTVDLLELATMRGVLLPARLRIDQRTQISGGQTKHFAVPTLDIDVRPLEMVAITRGGAAAAAGEIVDQRPELPVGYTPLEPSPKRGGLSVGEALSAAAEGAVAQTRTGRAAAPIGPTESFERDDPLPVAAEEMDVPQRTPADHPDAITSSQIKKLNTLVGRLRKAKQIKTEHLYSAVASTRNIAIEQLAEEVNGVDKDNELHWAPLRDSLSKDEASSLIERLERFEKNIGEAA